MECPSRQTFFQRFVLLVMPVARSYLAVFGLCATVDLIWQPTR